MEATSLKRLSGQAIRTTIVGIFVNAGLAAVKGVAGVVGQSYALVADAIESLLDIFHGLVVLTGLRVAAAEPDENHPYGHGKAEPLAAVVAGLGILGGALIIAIESGKQIGALDPPAPTPYTLLVIIGVIAVKEGMYRYVHGVGDRVESTAVKTDAWHHRSDAITSVAALVGIAIAVLGGEGYETADDWAALVACGIIGYNGVRLLLPSVHEIMDAAPAPEVEMQIRATAATVPRVVGLDTCYVRKMGFEFFVDLHVYVNGDMSVRDGHDVAHRVKDAILEKHPRVRDVLVHIEPEELKALKDQQGASPETLGAE